MSDHFDLTLPGARVTFSTRRGGVSEGPFSSLNLGLWTEDEADRVVENRRLLERHTNTAATALGRQMHGTELQEWSAPPSGADPPEVDGHLTRECRLGLLVLTADCLPVALASPDLVAMLHCGWRGLAGGIVERALERFGDGEPVSAAIGPGIGPCHYEVGPEVLEAFADLDGVAQGRMLDLKAVAAAKLRAGGVEHVHDVDRCTYCEPDV